MILKRIIIDLLTNKYDLKIPEGVKAFRFFVSIPKLKLWVNLTKNKFKRNPQLQLWANELKAELFNHFNGFSNNLQKKNSY